MTLKEKLRYGAIAGLALALLLFVCFNWEWVPINIIVMQVQMPKALLIILSFLAGVGMMWLWGLIKPRFAAKKDPGAP
ncbi:MAG: LapA family protein [Planctomycetes bacterium]|nr:LapA family protein [Planctomycetota bacterium]